MVRQLSDMSLAELRGPRSGLRARPRAGGPAPRGRPGGPARLALSPAVQTCTWRLHTRVGGRIAVFALSADLSAGLRRQPLALLPRSWSIFAGTSASERTWSGAGVRKGVGQDGLRL